jgi:glycosyltransferase involved in cell wall biosynthesis
MVSKALVVGAYQRKLEAIARQPDVELACIVPPAWRQDGRDFRLERAYTAGYELIVEPIRWNGSFHLFYFPGLGKQLSRLAPDVVHVDEEPYNLATFLSTRLALRQDARPLFFTWQNLDRRYPPPFRWLERYVLGHARHAIAGNAEAAVVIRRKGYRGALTVIPQFGVDPEVFSPGPGAQGLRPSPAPFLIGYLGRLVEEKGLWILLEAVAGLDGDWRLELFGHGPLRGALIARAADLGLAERIAVREPLPSTEVPAQLRRLDALVLPSLTRPNWKEQFGRALVEAMACGVPVVGSDSGEIPNVIGEAGLGFAEGDSAALRACLAELMASERRRAELGARGRARMLERFTHERIAEATVEVYREMMAGPQPNPLRRVRAGT